MHLDPRRRLGSWLMSGASARRPGCRRSLMSAACVSDASVANGGKAGCAPQAVSNAQVPAMALHDVYRFRDFPARPRFGYMLGDGIDPRPSGRSCMAVEVVARTRRRFTRAEYYRMV